MKKKPRRRRAKNVLVLSNGSRIHFKRYPGGPWKVRSCGEKRVLYVS